MTLFITTMQSVFEWLKPIFLSLKLHSLLATEKFLGTGQKTLFLTTCHTVKVLFKRTYLQCGKKNPFWEELLKTLFSQLYPFPKKCLFELLMENILFAFSSCFVIYQHNAN